ncbi:MAG: VOC family protein [Acidobacteriia bacterium]|nr:VOC family protein [Terriglobia bacterium]
MTAGPTPLALHHVGYVVPDIAAAAPSFALSLGASWDGCVYADPHQKVKVTFLATRPGDAQIELIEPAGEDSPVLGFLREKGGGLHHVCYEVPDLEDALAAMKSRGALLARPPKPAVAFRGRRIAWVLTREKLLIEFLEARSIQ